MSLKRALPVLAAAAILAVARTLKITDHETGQLVAWEPNAEQIAAVEAAEGGNAMILKPRAIGISTIFDLDDMLWTNQADVEGHAIRTAVFLDTDAKAKERIRVMRGFMKQLGLKERGKGNEHVIRFPKSGAEIVALSTGGEQPARSIQVQRVRWSERCFYPKGAMAAAGMAIGLAAREVIETTVSPDGGSYAEVREEWRNPRSPYAKVFFPLSMHREYRADPKEISDDEWRRMKKEGYVDGQRSTAAWFLTIGVRKVGGEAEAWHELPQIEPHLWRAGAGRIFKRAPAHCVVADVVDVPGVTGDVWKLAIHGEEVADPLSEGAEAVLDDDGHVVYDERTRRLRVREHSGQVVVTVDTCRGVNVTKSVVLATDKKDGEILGSFASGKISYDDLARVAAMAKDVFRAELVVEDDGVGDATCQALDRLGVPYTRFRQATTYQDKEGGRPKTNAERCLSFVRGKVDGGLERCPPEMAEECDELRRDERGNLVGLKDFVMTYGMALVHMETSPYDPGFRSIERAGRQFFKDDLAAYLRDKMGGVYDDGDADDGGW